MIAQKSILDKALRHYTRWLLQITKGGEPAYVPLVIDRVGDHPDKVDRWDALSELFAQSKDKIGYGYRLELEPPSPKSKNKQTRIKAIVFDTAEDLLQFTGQSAHFEQFKAEFDQIAAVPALLDWRSANPYDVLLHLGDWPQLLAVVRFFQDNPNVNLPLRLLPIEGVDTKFLERHNGILCKLLDNILIPKDPTNNYLSRRYGWAEDTILVECGWNDRRLIEYFRGFSRVALSVEELAEHPLPAKRVMVVENKNALPKLLQHPLPHTAVLLGGGFGVAILQKCAWLKQTDLYYWGDLDAHGMAILSLFRGFFPHTKSLLMDKRTLNYHAAYCVAAKPYNGAAPTNLTPAEQALFVELSENQTRLEQERLAAAWVGGAL